MATIIMTFDNPVILRNKVSRVSLGAVFQAVFEHFESQPLKVGETSCIFSCQHHALGLGIPVSRLNAAINDLDMGGDPQALIGIRSASPWEEIEVECLESIGGCRKGLKKVVNWLGAVLEVAV